jgi:hypothetical protein
LQCPSVCISFLNVTSLVLIGHAHLLTYDSDVLVFAFVLLALSIGHILIPVLIILMRQIVIKLLAAAQNSYCTADTVPLVTAWIVLHKLLKRTAP